VATPQHLEQQQKKRFFGEANNNKQQEYDEEDKGDDDEFTSRHQSTKQRKDMGGNRSLEKEGNNALTKMRGDGGECDMRSCEGAASAAAAALPEQLRSASCSSSLNPPSSFCHHL
jgi:hypothetical protein